MDEEAQIQRQLAEIRKLAGAKGRTPSPQAMKLAERVLRGEVTEEQARDELIRIHRPR